MLILSKMVEHVLSNVYPDLLLKAHQMLLSHTTVTMVTLIKKLKNVFVKPAVIRATKMLKTLGKIELITQYKPRYRI